MRSIILILSLWLVAPLVHAQRSATPVPSAQPGSLGYKLLGGFVGHALALTLSAGVLALTLAEAGGGSDDSGFGSAYRGLFVSGLVYAIAAPLMIGGGVAIAGSAAHRDTRFDLAVGGAALGVVTAAVLALGMQEATDDGDASALVLIATGLMLPPVFSALFSELIPSARSRALARVVPLVSISPARSALFVGARGAF